MTKYLLFIGLVNLLIQTPAYSGIRTQERNDSGCRQIREKICLLYARAYHPLQARTMIRSSNAKDQYYYSENEKERNAQLVSEKETWERAMVQWRDTLRQKREKAIQNLKASKVTFNEDGFNIFFNKEMAKFETAKGAMFEFFKEGKPIIKTSRQAIDATFLKYKAQLISQMRFLANVVEMAIVRGIDASTLPPESINQLIQGIGPTHNMQWFNLGFRLEDPRRNKSQNRTPI